MKLSDYKQIIYDEMSDETREFLANSTDDEKIAYAHLLLDAIEANFNEMFDKIEAARNKRCPFCGDEVNSDERDFAYPTDQSRLIWTANCSNGVCGATVYGSTKEEAIDNWNKRYENTKQN